MRGIAILRANTGIDSAASAWVVRRDAGLTAAEQAEFEQWRAADPRHAEAFVWQEKAWGALDQPRDTGRAEVMLRRFAVSAVRRRRRRLAGATVGLVALIVAGSLWRQSHSPDRPLSPATRAVVLLPEKRTLPDGSVVELRNGADIAVAYSEAIRHVVLRQGEAHFDVRKNDGRPFVVAARGVEVRAVGTAFSVELGDDAVAVLVTEGRVKVVPPLLEHQDSRNTSGPTARGASGPRTNAATSIDAPSSADDATAMVNAGEYVSVPFAPAPVPTTPQVLAVTDAETAERLAWRGARLEFTDTPLGDAVALMNQHSSGSQRVQFVIHDPALARVAVTGLFRAGNSETFVTLLEASFGVRAEHAGDTITLRKAR